MTYSFHYAGSCLTASPFVQFSGYNLCSDLSKSKPSKSGYGFERGNLSNARVFSWRASAGRENTSHEINFDAVGAFSGEGPPVPIPNTEVKLTSAENTCLATDWKDRAVPT